VLYYPPPLASGNITHPCNSRYIGKILLNAVGKRVVQEKLVNV
jgi:hypothetical protein